MPVSNHSLSRGVVAAIVAGFLTVGAPAEQTNAADRPGADRIQVIVSFKDTPGAAARSAIETVGGKISRRFRLIDALAADIPNKQLDALRRNELVASVELDHEIVAFDAELDAAWGVKHIGAGTVHAAGNTGQGIKVGVIDTGIDYTHVDLDGVYAGGYDFFNNDTDPFDDNGHGTHVAGTLAAERNDPPAGVVGVAPGVQIYSYKVLGADGSGDYSGLIAALERATLVDHVDVVNMSLGGTEASQALADAVAAAYAQGVVLVAAAGNVNPNTGQACPVAFPAAYDQVFATTFTGPDDALTGYSCTGPQVDFASPGDLIYSTVPTGNCMFCTPSGYRGDLSGTSMAAPHLSGTVALVLAHGISNQGDPTTLADDVKAHLCANTAVGTGVTYFGIFHVGILPSDPRYPEWFGCGVIDAEKALLVNPPPTGGPANSAPVATDDAATAAEDGQVTVDVLANDTDADGDALAVATVGSPAHGAAVIDASGSVVYTPAPNFWGSDSFTYEVTDGSTTATATVSVEVTAVNDAPVAVDDSASTDESTQVTVPVLDNDSDVDGDALAVTAVGPASHGTTAVYAGSVTYTPASGFAGADSFTYDVSDGHGGSATATVVVTVAAPPAPTMHVSDLDRTATGQTKKWTAKVTIRVRSATETAVAGATVSGTWSTGASMICTTGSRGNCTVTLSAIPRTTLSVTFSVTNVARSGWVYLPSANHDPEADSDGTSITVSRP